MSWRDSLRPASFRGVPFEVDVGKVPVGRRTVTHEYPGKDRPYVEDLGRVTREHKVTGYVIGPDFMDKRDALLRALETEGPGELVHPWLGTLTVTAGIGEMAHAHDEGGMCRFDLTFTESGDLTFPAGVANTGKRAASAGSALAESGLSRFEEAIVLVNRGQLSASQLVRGATGMVDVLRRYASPIAAAIGSAEALATQLINAPGELVGTIRGVLASAGGAFRVFDGFGGSLASLFGETSAVAELAATPAPVDAQAAALQRAAVTLVQDLVLAEAVSEVGEIPVAPAPAPLVTAPALQTQVLQPVEQPDVPVADDILAVRDALSDALWEQAVTSPQSHYQRLTDARIQSGRHLLAVARQGRRLETVTPAQTAPALVLAYARYGDATRAPELVDRNRIVHPGFVPPVPLQVAAT